jgi:hypothetical protein
MSIEGTLRRGRAAAAPTVAREGFHEVNKWRSFRMLHTNGQCSPVDYYVACVSCGTKSKSFLFSEGGKT